MTDKSNSDILDGESGSWIIDEQTLEVFGHLVASDILGSGYVIPMRAILEDIGNHHGAYAVLGINLYKNLVCVLLANQLCE
jgi:hypothetical protein